MKLKDLIKILESNGFYLKRSGKHLAYSNGTVTVFVPHHKEVKSWTVNKIRKESGLVF